MLTFNVKAMRKFSKGFLTSTRIFHQRGKWQNGEIREEKSLKVVFAPFKWNIKIARKI